MRKAQPFYCIIKYLYKCIFLCTTRARKRQFTRWSARDCEVVVQYFRDCISSEHGSGLPGKEDIMRFKEQNNSIAYDWTTVRNKVLNEKMAFAKRKRMRLDNLMHWVRIKDQFTVQGKAVLWLQKLAFFWQIWTISKCFCFYSRIVSWF